MRSRACMTMIVLVSLAGRAEADGGTASADSGTASAGSATAAAGGSAAGKDDGFFTRVKILGSTMGQIQKDNAALSGGLGLSAENTRHFLYLLINSGLNQKPPATGAPATSY